MVREPHRRRVSTPVNDVLDALDRGELTDVIDAFEQLGQLDDLERSPRHRRGRDRPERTDRPGESATATALRRATRSSMRPPACSACRTASPSGTIDADLVNPPFRFPECGAAEAYWLDVYSMGDAEFVALVESASPCFLGLVAAGQIEAVHAAHRDARPGRASRVGTGTPRPTPSTPTASSSAPAPP